MQNWTEKQFLPNALEPFTLSYCVRSPSYSTQKHRGTYVYSNPKILFVKKRNLNREWCMTSLQWGAAVVDAARCSASAVVLSMRTLGIRGCLESGSSVTGNRPVEAWSPSVY